MPKFMSLCFLLFFLHAIAVPLLSETGSEAVLGLDAPAQETEISIREVFDPPIISPNSTTVWKVGETVTVVWNTTNLPPDSQLTNPNGTLLLGFLTSESENLMVDSPLAEGFKLSSGRINITVPSVSSKDNYIVALLGDSGNISPTFSIVGTASTSTGPTTTSTSTSFATVSPTSLTSTSTIIAPPTSSISPPVSDTTTSSSVSPSTSLTTPSAFSTSITPISSSESSNTSASTTATTTTATSTTSTNTSEGFKLTFNLLVFAASLFVFILNI